MTRGYGYTIEDIRVLPDDPQRSRQDTHDHQTIAARERPRFFSPTTIR